MKTKPTLMPIMKSNEVHLLETDMLVPHPLNRAFRTDGEEWDEFVESVRIPGIENPLTVRDLGDGTWQILSGHRRHAAAMECGIKTAPCLLRELSDSEALICLVNENLQRLSLSPVDEARLLDAMGAQLGMHEEEIARRVSRSLQWVRTRQMMLTLGDDLLNAVRETRPEKHISMATVEEILRAPETYRDRAVQLCLHPILDTRPLGPDQAREMIRQCLIEPDLAQKAWDTAAAPLAKTWLTRLAGLTQFGKKSLTVRTAPWAERNSIPKNAAPAEEEVSSADKTPGAPARLIWADVAARHGLSVVIYPSAADGGESLALVDAPILYMAEAARDENGMDAWLNAKPAGRDKRVAAALAALDGEPDPDYDDSEPPEKHISQTMDHRAWIDMGAVKKVAFWAISDAADPMDPPDWLPQWVAELGVEGMWTQIDSICEWVYGLKGKE